jgi:signal transduction histidine kinase/DNA-binding response OmpR family regulator
MDTQKSTIPVKIVISYLLLALLVLFVGWFLYSENKDFSATEVKITKEKNKILQIGNLLSNLYKTESLARQIIQSESDEDYKKYTHQINFVKQQIDSLKLLDASSSQIVLLDSVKFLLTKKTQNIIQLKYIKNKANTEVSVTNAINNLTQMEQSLSKLRIEDLVKNPMSMGSYQRNVLKKYVAYLNQNIPDDSTNTLTKKASDSIILASKTLLNNVKKETEKRKIEANIEEKKLLQNEISISEQLRKILNIIKREIILNTSKNDLEKGKSLKRTNTMVTIVAIVALFLAIFFSILILSDFSKTQSYKNQLEMANLKKETLLKSREQLISTVSHDLKTPLNTISGYAALLSDSELNKKQHYFTQNIKISSEYVLKLVQDLLDFTQIETGKITIEKNSFSLSKIINEVASSAQSVNADKNIKLTIEVNAVFDQNIMGDSFRLRQVLSNIIGNAYKFTQKGFIKISAFPSHNKPYFTIKIEDSGIGIEYNKQELIFEEFTQVSNDPEHKHEGSGLGLTISKKIITILGGTITLESVYGKGSVFEITIPLQWDETVFKNIRKSTKIASLIAIVVDDDVNLLNLTSEILRQNNFKVFSFTNAEEAIKKSKTSKFDFVITDIQMPKMDGFALVKKIKDNNYKNQPIIALTGKIDIPMETYQNAGFTIVVKKPFSPKGLMETVNLVLNRADKSLDFKTLMDENFESNEFSLSSLNSFFPNNEVALKEVLATFMSNTNQSLLALKKAITDNNSQAIKEISHRICPMFKQIKAQEIYTILEDLEFKKNTIKENTIHFDQLDLKVKHLFLELEKI